MNLWGVVDVVINHNCIDVDCICFVAFAKYRLILKIG